MTRATHPRPAPDDDVRRRIVADTDRNVLLEAGAGSGKTTLLTSRIVSLLASGAAVEHIAAVTFTRKAAGELRERVQARLEHVLAGKGEADDPWDATAPLVRERLERALASIDRLFLGTVHAFCARLLRERPLDAGLDPSFEELEPVAAEELVKDWYRRFLERLEAEDDERLVHFERLGIDLHVLSGAFVAFTESPDVDWSADPVAAPSTGALLARVRKAVSQTLARAPEGPDRQANALWRLCRRLQFLERTRDWATPRDACDALAAVAAWDSATDFGVKFWAGGLSKAQKDAVQDLRVLWEQLADESTAVVAQWLAHRYAILVDFLHEAERDCRAWRARLGRLTFTDLLSQAAALLRHHERSRHALAHHWRYLLVDEFQDTDPLQAEVMFRLAARPDAPPGAPWHALPLRDGALFVVGDPKQSIYRFRRADVATWRAVQARMRVVGQTLALTSNFRSRAGLVTFVNAHFARAFAAATEVEAQVPYTPMTPTKPDDETPPVVRHLITPRTGRGGKASIAAVEADAMAAWIADEIRRGARTPESFLVLTRDRSQLDAYARAIARTGIAVSVSGAASRLDRELAALQRLLEALADPTNPIRVVAVLEGPFVGATPADLFEARAAEVSFTAAAPPAALPDGASVGARVVHAALTRIHAWWQRVGTVSADVLMSQLLDETGLLAMAAADPLGDSRAGVLLGLVTLVREEGRTRGLGLDAALAAVTAVLDDEAPDFSLRPGRTDAVRVMNVHKAKGLEADVVVLAQPSARTQRSYQRHVERRDDGAFGAMCIVADDGATVACPLDWGEREARESVAAAAEETRLEYVAATRAREVLVISTSTEDDGKAQWAELAHASADRPALVVPPLVAVAPATLDDASPILAATEAASARRAAASVPTWRQETITRFAKQPTDAPDASDPADPTWIPPRRDAHREDGRAWGRIVHAALEALGRGGDLAAVQRAARHVAEEQMDMTETPDAAAARAVHVAQRVERSPEWALIRHAVRREFEWPITWWDASTGTLLEGVADVAVRDAAGHWTVIDWKTDRTLDAERRARYQRQVDLYADAVRALTGEPAVGRIVWTTEPEEPVA